MLIRFFETLRDFRVPISTRELLDLLAVLRQGLGFADREAFYFLARLTLVKDERFFDRFDRAFQYFFDGVGALEGVFDTLLTPQQTEALLRDLLQLPAGQRPNVDAELRELLAGYRDAMQALRARRDADSANGEDRSQRGNESETAEDDGDRARDADDHRTDEQQPDCSAEGSEGDEPGEGEDAGDGEGEGEGEGEDGEGEEGEDGKGEQGEGGEDGVGREGESPEGADGEYEAGMRRDQDESRRRSAAKIWEQRLFADLDDDVELGTRTFKIALRRLRKFARIGAEEELDMPGTIDGTARNGGVLDIRMVPERRNNVKVLLFLDIGGSMDEHVMTCEQLFSAARAEFKYLVEFYFHNFTYDYVWTNAARSDEHRVNLIDLVRTYGRDYKVVFVGDANMGLHEILERGGCIERYNEEPGVAWFNQLTAHFKRVAWINPMPVDAWRGTFSTVRVQRMVDEHMYPLTNDGLTQAMRWLAK